MPNLIKYEYTKTILENICIGSMLFCKELLISTINSLPYEIEQFIIWSDYFTNKKPELKPCLIVVK